MGPPCMEDQLVLVAFSGSSYSVHGNPTKVKLSKDLSATYQTRVCGHKEAILTIFQCYT